MLTNKQYVWWQIIDPSVKQRVNSDYLDEIMQFFLTRSFNVYSANIDLAKKASNILH